MNKTRRIQLEAIAQKLESLQGDLYTIMNEEEESYDNMPESIQGGERRRNRASCHRSVG